MPLSIPTGPTFNDQFLIVHEYVLKNFLLRLGGRHVYLFFQRQLHCDDWNVFKDRDDERVALLARLELVFYWAVDSEALDFNRLTSKADGDRLHFLVHDLVNPNSACLGCLHANFEFFLDRGDLDLIGVIAICGRGISGRGLRDLYHGYAPAKKAEAIASADLRS